MKIEKFFPWWLAALLGVILYPALTYLPSYLLVDEQLITFCKKAAPILCFGLFLYGGMAIYERPIKNSMPDEEDEETESCNK